MSIDQEIYIRLKRLARNQNKTLQDILTMYAIERSLYRLSVSNYRDLFVLKGGVLLYFFYEGNYGRSTTDIDLLTRSNKHQLMTLKDIFHETFKIEVLQDGLIYDYASLKVEDYSNNQRITYKLSVNASLAKANLKLSFDISYGDIITPNAVERKFISSIDESIISLMTYPLESLIAEKLHVILTFGLVNTRLKDYYDIYLIANSHNLINEILEEAITSTFKNRLTKTTFSVSYINEIINDLDLQMLWEGFIRSKNLDVTRDFKEVARTVLSCIPKNWLI